MLERPVELDRLELLRRFAESCGGTAASRMPERASSSSQTARFLGDPPRYCGGKGGVGAHDSRTAGAAPCVEFQEDKRRDLVAARGLSLVYGFHSSASTLGRIAMSALDSPDTWAVRITDTLFDELTERRVAGFQIFRFSSPRPPPRAGGRREPRVGRRLRRLHLAQKRPVARVIADALELEARLRSALPTGDNGYHPGAEGFAY